MYSGTQSRKGLKNMNSVVYYFLNQYQTLLFCSTENKVTDLVNLLVFYKQR